MKLVQWDDDGVPPVLEITEEHVIVMDSHWEYNLEEGDLVQSISEEGTTCFHVVHVEEDTQASQYRSVWLEMAREFG